MYKNKAKDGGNNICGQRIKEIRENLPEKTSQRKLADMLQMAGLDIELKVIAEVLGVSYQELLD